MRRIRARRFRLPDFLASALTTVVLFSVSIGAPIGHADTLDSANLLDLGRLTKTVGTPDLPTSDARQASNSAESTNEDDPFGDSTELLKLLQGQSQSKWLFTTPHGAESAANSDVNSSDASRRSPLTSFQELLSTDLGATDSVRNSSKSPSDTDLSLGLAMIALNDTGAWTKDETQKRSPGRGEYSPKQLFLLTIVSGTFLSLVPLLIGTQLRIGSSSDWRSLALASMCILTLMIVKTMFTDRSAETWQLKRTIALSCFPPVAAALGCIVTATLVSGQNRSITGSLMRLWHLQLSLPSIKWSELRFVRRRSRYEWSTRPGEKPNDPLGATAAVGSIEISTSRDDSEFNNGSGHAQVPALLPRADTANQELLAVNSNSVGSSRTGIRHRSRWSGWFRPLYWWKNRHRLRLERRRREFTDRLEQIAASNPPEFGKVVIIVDDVAWHRGVEVDELLQRLSHLDLRYKKTKLSAQASRSSGRRRRRRRSRGLYEIVGEAFESFHRISKSKNRRRRRYWSKPVARKSDSGAVVIK